MWQKLRMQIFCNGLPRFWADHHILIYYTHCWELMKSMCNSHGSSSLLFMIKKVMVWHFVSDSHKVMTTLNSCVTFKMLWRFLCNNYTYNKSPGLYTCAFLWPQQGLYTSLILPLCAGFGKGYINWRDDILFHTSNWAWLWQHIWESIECHAFCSTFCWKSASHIPHWQALEWWQLWRWRNSGELPMLTPSLHKHFV